jgi:hypothetical protein
MDAKRLVRRSVRITVYTLFVLLIVAVLLPGLLNLPIQFAGLLLFGWVSYARSVLPRVSFNPEIAANAIITLALATAGLHRALVWWGRKQSGQSTRWRFVSTLKIVTMVLLLFATSIAATGIVHQIGWFFRADELTYDASRGLMTREISNMKGVAVALRLYTDDFGGKLPRDLDELIPDYLPDRTLLFSTIERGEPPEQILYFPDHKTADPASAIIVAGPHVSASGKRTVARRDTSIQVVKEDEFQEMRRQQTPPSGSLAPRPQR